MGATTKIEWCDHTFNPWTGCEKVSAGCVNCYAESWSKRTNLVEWGREGTRKRTSEANWREPWRWNQAAIRDGVRRRVFCASLADVFEDREELLPWREELFALIENTPALDWLLLTKRPYNIAKFMPNAWHAGAPLDNVWLGTSVENQEVARERITWLARTPATVRFLSCEPLLTPLDLRPFLGEFQRTYRGDFGRLFDWVIVGGESGPRSRRLQVEWVRDLREQCRAAGVAFFNKQLGRRAFTATSSDVLACGGKMHTDAEGRVTYELAITDKKGGDWDEWPADLRVREFPR